MSQFLASDSEQWARQVEVLMKNEVAIGVAAIAAAAFFILRAFLTV